MKNRINLLQRISVITFILAILLIAGCVSKTTESETTTAAMATQTSTPATATTSSVIFPPGTDLPFENMVPIGNIGGDYTDVSAQIIIITNNTDSFLSNNNWVITEDKNMLDAIDYSQYFAVITFNGWRGGIGDTPFSVNRIWEKNNFVYILAHFDDFTITKTYNELNNSQYQITKINKTNLSQTGEITFQLLDETGKERATTTVNITGN
jgi:hypothetical protein